MRWLIAAMLASGVAYGQATGAELVQTETPFTFQSRVQIVLVPVVVRDAAGKPVASLRKENFAVYDNGKPQDVVKFSIERRAGLDEGGGANTAGVDSVKASAAPPDHFIVYVFDDIHLSGGDLIQAREAMRRHLAEALGPGVRAAVYTTSGSTALDFTDDRGLLDRTLTAMMPHGRSAGSGCLDMTWYMADAIRNRGDREVENVAVQEAIQCFNLQSVPAAVALVQNTAIRVLASGDEDARASLAVLSDAVRKLATAAGQRIAVLASPGFQLGQGHARDEGEILNEAIRNRVAINSIDARGLTSGIADASRPGHQQGVFTERSRYDRLAALLESEVLANVAAGTGGVFFKNSNDLKGGFDRAAAAPEVWYVLGFSPANLKADGAWHALKVSLRNANGLTVDARHGYYAPNHAASVEEQAREEISGALFSRDEMGDIPVRLRTEFFKSSENAAVLGVVANVDVRKLRYKPEEGRDRNRVRLAFGLFDRDGNFLQGASRVLELRLKEETLHARLDSGINVRTEFKTAPGTYLVRLVVRDDEGQTMASRNGTVEIP